MILSIDTSTAQAGIALTDGENVRGEISWVTAANHSTDLFAAFDTLWRLTGASIEEVTAVAIASGPGSFSGIRVGMSAGKAMALARGIPLVGIPTLDAIALAARPAPRVWSILPAGRGQLYVAAYRTDTQPLERESPYEIDGVSTMADRLMPGDVVAGEGIELVRAMMADSAQIHWQPPPARLRRAAYLAELARAYFASGGHDQILGAEPLYLRRSAAEEKRDASRE
jgi:tRNA threonylcarbamoyladenosine biosynthesis protein TsaB